MVSAFFCNIFVNFYSCFYVFKKTALVFSFVFGTILYRTAVKIALINLDIPSFTSNAGLVTTFTSAIINLIIICLLGLFYSWVAVKLTDLGFVLFKIIFLIS